MKRKCFSGIMVMALLLLGSCGKQPSYVGADEAKQLALDTCGKTAEEADSVTVDLVRRNDKDYYQIDIMAEGQHYQIEIDAVAGVVAEVRVSAGTQGTDAAGNSQESGAASDQAGLPGSGQEGQPVSDQAGQLVSGRTNQPDGAEHHGDEGHGSRSDRQSTSGPAEGSAGADAAEGMIPLEDAKTNALTHAGLTADQVTFAKEKLDYENGRQVYELEFYTGDRKEYDYEIDAYSGEVVGFDYDAEHYVPSQASGEAITAEDARALALSKVPGAADSDVREFETDYEDGCTEYEGKIIYNGTEYEFEIDAYGQILSWEEEPVRGR